MATIEELKIKAEEIRLLCGEAFLQTGSGHLGGAFSMADCIAVLFFQIIKDNPKDWFVLSKGHAGPSYYAALVLKGKITKKDLLTLNQPGTLVPSHPDRLKTNGVDCSTGSLGQGISQAVGIAYGLKMNNEDGKVYCIIGDGECNEGEVWEAFQFASNKKLDNLVLIIDDNKKQVDGYTESISCKFDFSKIGDLFDFYTQEIDGNDISSLLDAFANIPENSKGRTSFISMNTIKGKGIPYFEKSSNCHHVRFGERERIEMEKCMNQWRKDISLYGQQH